MIIELLYSFIPDNVMVISTIVVVTKQPCPWWLFYHDSWSPTQYGLWSYPGLLPEVRPRLPPKPHLPGRSRCVWSLRWWHPRQPMRRSHAANGRLAPHAHLHRTVSAHAWPHWDSPTAVDLETWHHHIARHDIILYMKSSYRLTFLHHIDEYEIII